MIRSLIAAGANPNITSRQGLTPIGLAVNMGFSGCLAVLLRSGGSPHSNNGSGPTLVQSAFLELYPTCLALLFQAGVATENMFADSEPYSADLLKRLTTNYKLDTPGGRCQQILLVAKAYNARSWQWPSSTAIATSANQNEQKEGDGAGKGVVGSKPARNAASWMRPRRGVFVPAVLRLVDEDADRGQINVLATDPHGLDVRCRLRSFEAWCCPSQCTLSYPVVAFYL